MSAGAPTLDLGRRWGLALCTAAGPDVIRARTAGGDWTAPKRTSRRRDTGMASRPIGMRPGRANWSAGAGAPFRHLSFMRGAIDWFLARRRNRWPRRPSLLGQRVGRLIGAVDRFRRASGAGLGPLRANINEVVTFIDFESPA